MLGVTSSLAATAATVGLGWLTSWRIRRRLLVALSRLTGLGVLRIHRHQDDARGDLAEELKRARWLRVMVGRGNELTRDGFVPVWSGEGRSPDSVRILLPDPRTSEEGRSWLERRERELLAADPGFHRGLLREQVLANFHYLAEATKGSSGTEIRFYDLPNLYRIIATDNTVFLTLYRNGAHGRHSPCIVAHRSSRLYDFALRIFATAWESGRTPDQADLLPHRGLPRIGSEDHRGGSDHPFPPLSPRSASPSPVPGNTGAPASEDQP